MKTSIFKRAFAVFSLLAFIGLLFTGCDKSPTVKFTKGVKIESVAYVKIFPAVVPGVLTVTPNIGSYPIRYSIGKEQKERYGFPGFCYRDQLKS